MVVVVLKARNLKTAGAGAAAKKASPEAASTSTTPKKRGPRAVGFIIIVVQNAWLMFSVKRAVLCWGMNGGRGTTSKRDRTLVVQWAVKDLQLSWCWARLNLIRVMTFFFVPHGGPQLVPPLENEKRQLHAIAGRAERTIHHNKQPNKKGREKEKE